MLFFLKYSGKLKSNRYQAGEGVTAGLQWALRAQRPGVPPLALALGDWRGRPRDLVSAGRGGPGEGREAEFNNRVRTVLVRQDIPSWAGMAVRMQCALSFREDTRRRDTGRKPKYGSC